MSSLEARSRAGGRRRTRGHNPAHFPVLADQVRTSTGMFYAPSGRNLCRDWPWFRARPQTAARTPLPDRLLGLLHTLSRDHAPLPADAVLAHFLDVGRGALEDAYAGLALAGSIAHWTCAKRWPGQRVVRLLGSGAVLRTPLAPLAWGRAP